MPTLSYARHSLVDYCFIRIENIVRAFDTLPTSSRRVCGFEACWDQSAGPLAHLRRYPCFGGAQCLTNAWISEMIGEGSLPLLCRVLWESLAWAVRYSPLHRPRNRFSSPPTLLDQYNSHLLCASCFVPLLLPLTLRSAHCFHVAKANFDCQESLSAAFLVGRHQSHAPSPGSCSPFAVPQYKILLLLLHHLPYLHLDASRLLSQRLQKDQDVQRVPWIESGISAYTPDSSQARANLGSSQRTK